MRKLIFGIVIALALMTFGSAGAQTEVRAGISVGDNGVNSFYLAIGSFYHVPEREVVAVRDKDIPDDQLPVVFFIARRAHVDPDLVIKLRLGGKSWLEITHYYKLSPEIYYIDAGDISGPPYGKAFGYFRNHPRSEWREARLDDDDIINLVNLRFLSSHYKRTPAEIIRSREAGHNFVIINNDFYQARHEHHNDAKAKQDKPKKNGHGEHGKGKGHDK
ncbi:conserved exported hypothetical protein [Candidatus Zixiibacteriota bacterium]|nr:conserved exported hypothetical protein [candidate division Zixibacteria bacterium]